MANKNIVKGDIGNALHSVAPDHIVTTSDEVFDETLQMYQNEVNFLKGVFDISAYNLTDGQPTKYADLTAALGTNGINVPEQYRVPGMRIQYVQSSDNKYVQYFLTKDEWSLSEADWQKMNLEEEVSQLGQEVDNPEWVRVVTDDDDRILYGVKTDGKFYFGDGCPPQVQEYVQNIIDGLSLDEYEDIVTFLSDYLGSDTTLKIMIEGINAQIATKVDKVEGKSLIDADYASSQSAIDNQEYLQVTTDSEDKILEGIKQDGTKVVGGDLEVGGDTKILGNMEVSGVSYKIIENPEYITAWVDAKDKVIFGLKADGKTYIGDGNFLDVIKSNQEAISEMNDILSTVYNSMNSLDINALTSITVVGNHEFISAETDSEGKVLSYRDSNGVLHECSGVDTKVVTAENVYGGNIDSCNFYTGELLCVERPKIAEMWFTGKLPTDTSDARIPTNLDTVFKVNGKTIFKCRCTLALQGHGTLTLPKQGYTFEPYNESGDAISIKFGDMIATDSFHLKGYYTDPLQCKDIGNYHIYADMLKHLDYPYCRMNNISGDYASAYNKDKCSFGDAKYVPDGFPVLLFLNGNFHGIYTLKLKKTRQNYAMEKSTKAQIFLDAQGENRSFFNQAFREDGWDLKNPKIKGYEEGGTITDTGVLENIQRLWSFTTDFINQYENYSDYIVLPHWILYLIFQELIGNWDSVGNNINVVTWDATHWSIIPWDTDESLGVTHAKNIDTTASNVVMGDIWSDFRTVFAEDISAMWTMMRNSGFITVGNLLSYYKDIVSVIPREYYEKDMKKWGNYYLNGVYTINTLAECLNNKIEFLDSIWYNQN